MYILRLVINNFKEDWRIKNLLKILHLYVPAAHKTVITIVCEVFLGFMYSWIAFLLQYTITQA
jgi:hypothetical protein